MTTINYIHTRLQQDFAEKSLEIKMWMDNILDDMLRSEPQDFTDYDLSPFDIDPSEFDGFQFLFDELLYPYLAMRQSMKMAGV